MQSLAYCGVLEPSWCEEGIHALQSGAGRGQCRIWEHSRPEKSIQSGVRKGLARQGESESV